MYILGIESSCDETAAAVIERHDNVVTHGSNRVLDEKIKSQIDLHAKYGGVVPEVASRIHYEVIDQLVNDALKTSNLTLKDIDLISLTQGPGLMGSLLVGLAFVKGLAFANRIPVVGVDHILAHIEGAFIDHQDIEYPLIALVVSGGHTTLFLQKSKFETSVLSKTRDDAVGEIFDKVAKFFGLGYPGGPILDKIYKNGDRKRFKFTFPKMSDGSDDFSFSGYKTAAIRHPGLDTNNLQTDSQTFKDFIASFMNSVVDYLLHKTKIAIEQVQPKSLIIAGGVSRNSLLREKFTQAFTGSPVKLVLTSPQYCTDNASMIAWLGYETVRKFPDLNLFDNQMNAYSRALFRIPDSKYR